MTWSSGTNSSPERPSVELRYLRSLLCVEATFNMDPKALGKLVESISKTVKSFKKSEVESLIILFHGLVEKPDERLDNARLDRSTFRMVLHGLFGMTDDKLMNRVFFAFDKDSDNCISVNEWVKGLSVFLRGTLEEKLKSSTLSFKIQKLQVFLFTFQGVFYLVERNIIKEEIFDMLKNSLHQELSEEETDEGIRELVEITLKKMDYDNDGKISFADFEKAVKEDRLLLEVFGQCLPEEKTCLDFETLAFKHILNSI